MCPKIKGSILDTGQVDLEIEKNILPALADNMAQKIKVQTLSGFFCARHVICDAILDKIGLHKNNFGIRVLT
jgi:hypothetical protein